MINRCLNMKRMTTKKKIEERYKEAVKEAVNRNFWRNWAKEAGEEFERLKKSNTILKQTTWRETLIIDLLKELRNRDFDGVRIDDYSLKENRYLFLSLTLEKTEKIEGEEVECLVDIKRATEEKEW